MFLFVKDIHFADIGCLYWQKQQRNAPGRILRTSLNGASTILSFALSVIYVPIDCRYPFTRYWQPLLSKTTAACSLPHPDSERQRSVNSFSCSIFGNHGIARIFMCISKLLAALIGNKTIYQRRNTYSELINVASCKASKNVLLDAEHAILI
jgi:hypothetical protein